MKLGLESHTVIHVKILAKLCQSNLENRWSWIGCSKRHRHMTITMICTDLQGKNKKHYYIPYHHYYTIMHWFLGCSWEIPTIFVKVASWKPLATDLILRTGFYNAKKWLSLGQRSCWKQQFLALQHGLPKTPTGELRADTNHHEMDWNSPKMPKVCTITIQFSIRGTSWERQSSQHV
jgi:hypothetical protein